MTGPMRPFGDFRLRGGRYEQPGYPVEVVGELSRYEQLVQDVARGLWKAENPSRKRTPKGFSESLDLRLARIDEGSTIPILQRPVADRGPIEEDAPGLEDYFDRARSLIEDAIGSLGEGASLPDRFPLSARNSLLRFGKSFRDDERVEFRWKDVRPVVYGRQERQRLASRLANVRYSADGTAVGRVTGVHAEPRTFLFVTLSGQQISGRFDDPSLSEDFIAVLNTVAEAPVVRLDGELVQTSAGEVVEIADVRSVEQFEREDEPWSDRLVTLLSIQPGWFDGAGERIELASVEAARTLLRAVVAPEAEVPGIYPMTDGGIQVEWRSERAVLSVEIDENVRFECYELTLQDKKERELTTENVEEVVAFVLGERS